MIVTDPIADFFARIKNAQQRNRETIVVPGSNKIEAIAAILKDRGFINDFKVHNESVQSEVEVTLKYEDDKPGMTDFSRVSKPGVRIYEGYKDIRKVLNGLGVAIYTTSKGILTGEQARAAQVGGELLVKVW